MFDVAPCRELSCGGSGRHIKTGLFLSALTLFTYSHKHLPIDPERSGGQHPNTPTPRSLPPNGKQSLDSRPQSPFPQPFPTPSPQPEPSPPPSQNRLIYG